MLFSWYDFGCCLLLFAIVVAVSVVSACLLAGWCAAAAAGAAIAAIAHTHTHKHTTPVNNNNFSFSRLSFSSEQKFPSFSCSIYRRRARIFQFMHTTHCRCCCCFHSARINIIIILSLCCAVHEPSERKARKRDEKNARKSFAPKQETRFVTWNFPPASASLKTTTITVYGGHG